MKKLIGGLVTAAGLFGIVGLGTVRASEGYFELKNQVGEDARCYAVSGLMQNLEYEVLVLCQDILYPGGTSVVNYVVWANPIGGGNPIRLGTLDLGKVQLSTKTAFSSLFVTKEENAKVRSPQGSVVMRGNLQKIPLLENSGTASTNEPELGTPEVTPTPKPASSINVFRVGGAVAFVLLVLVVGLVFVITKG